MLTIFLCKASRQLKISAIHPTMFILYSTLCCLGATQMKQLKIIGLMSMSVALMQWA